MVRDTLKARHATLSTMSASPISPRAKKGAFLLYRDPNFAPKSIIFQYNPDSVQRTLIPQSLPEAGTKEPDPYLVKGQPIETITLDVEFDATDSLEHPDKNTTADLIGIYPQLAALESIMRPQTTVPTNTAQLDTPYAVFVWGTNRIVPVLLTNYLATEEAFDPNLNPTRAKVRIMMRVLTADDFPLNHPGRKVYLDHLRRLEELAALAYQ